MLPRVCCVAIVVTELSADDDYADDSDGLVCHVGDGFVIVGRDSCCSASELTVFAFAGFTVIKPKCCPLICPLFLLFSTTKEIVAVCYENDSCFCN